MRNILARYPALTSFSSASTTTSASTAAAASRSTHTRAFASNTNLFSFNTNQSLTTPNLTTTHQPTAHQIRTLKMTVPKTQEPTITSITELTPSESKWLTLQQISYVDQTGKSRLWEVAARKTRSAPPPSSSSSGPSTSTSGSGSGSSPPSTTLGSASGVDAVAMANILLHPSLPPSTLLVIQYRPPLDAYTIEWPAGLIDKGESPEEAAIREFKEETGYDCTVTKISPVQAADPGMSSANMVMATVEVNLPEGEEMPEQRLEDGEHITRVVVPLSELYERLVEYSKKERHVVAAKLFHFAEGMNFAVTERYGVFNKKD